MTTKKVPAKNGVARSEIRIFVSDQSREVVLESSLERSVALALINTAISAGSALVLEDVRGRQVVVPAVKIGYVEIGDVSERKVGFGSL